MENGAVQTNMVDLGDSQQESAHIEDSSSTSSHERIYIRDVIPDPLGARTLSQDRDDSQNPVEDISISNNAIGPASPESPPVQISEAYTQEYEAIVVH
jgi:hypothetical protein